MTHVRMLPRGQACRPHPRSTYRPQGLAKISLGLLSVQRHSLYFVKENTMLFTSHPSWSIVAFSIVVSTLSGCTGKPKAVEVPPIKPEEAAQEAMATYDKNGDGQLADEELASCPALQGAIARYDKNRDRKISKVELIERFTTWAQGSIGVARMVCTVTLDGQSLADAKVEFIPEEFLDGAVAPASGTTDKSGRTTLAMDPSKLPSDLQGFRGVNQGLYKIKVTHPSIAIPAKYNTKSTLGKEISVEGGETAMRLPLSSR